jgi:succinoglycan biosynthesis transport protein ExoP
MLSTRLRALEVRAAIQRRWKLMLIPTVLVTTLCVIGAYRLPRKYESSTTILVKPDQTLKPMAGFEIAMAFEEELRNFNEILYSRTLLLSLADSLGLAANVKTERDRLVLVAGISGNIRTTRLGSNSFRIAYVDTDPKRAQRAAAVITNLFIQTKLGVDTRQNALTVEFYEKKAQEYRAAFDSSVHSLVSAMKQNVSELPRESRSLYSQVDEIQRSLDITHARMKMYREALSVLKAGISLRTEAGKRALLRLQQEDLPSVAELKTLSARYDEASHRYTSNYPELDKLEDEIVQALEHIRKLVETELPNLELQESQLDSQRGQIIEELERSASLTRLNQDKQSSYDINLRLYDEMKMKLEQARLTQEVLNQGANQFFIIDPAYLPAYPSQPHRLTIVFSGLGIGLFLGLLAAVIGELLDTTVRTPKDIEVYQKPVIAYLPDRSQE